MFVELCFISRGGVDINVSVHWIVWSLDFEREVVCFHKKSSININQTLVYNSKEIVFPPASI